MICAINWPVFFLKSFPIWRNLSMRFFFTIEPFLSYPRCIRVAIWAFIVIDGWNIICGKLRNNNMLSDIYWIKLITSNDFHFLCTLWSITSYNQYRYWQGEWFIILLRNRISLESVSQHTSRISSLPCCRSWQGRLPCSTGSIPYISSLQPHHILPGRKGRSAYVEGSTSSGSRCGSSARNWFIRPVCLLSRWRRSPFRWLLLRGKATNLWALCPA